MADVPFDMTAVKGLFKNKWMLGGVAVAAGAGGFVLYKKKKAGNSSSSSTGTDQAAGATTVPYGSGFMNTSGTDFANWVGQYSGSLQNQLDAFAKQQTDFLSKLPGSPASPTGGTASGWAAPGSVGYQPKPTGSVTRKVQAGDTWAMYLKNYFHGGATTNTAALEAWSGLMGGTSSPTLTAGQIVKLPTSSPGYAPGSSPGV